MPGLFITATGTDIGKTFITAGLIRAGRRAGYAVDAFKPVLSGFDPDDAATSDAGVLLAALGRPLTAGAVAAISPWRFAAPLSPNMAAAAEGQCLELAEMVAACRAAVMPERLTLIEAVGGVMVPLNERHTVLDLAAVLALPVLLITGTYLGALSHCLTAVAALVSRGLHAELIVVNESAGSTVPTQATEATLRRFCPASDFAIIPRAPAERAFDELFARVVSSATPSRPP